MVFQTQRHYKAVATKLASGQCLLIVTRNSAVNITRCSEDDLMEKALEKLKFNKNNYPKGCFDDVCRQKLFM